MNRVAKVKHRKAKLLSIFRRCNGKTLLSDVNKWTWSVEVERSTELHCMCIHLHGASRPPGPPHSPHSSNACTLCGSGPLNRPLGVSVQLNRHKSQKRPYLRAPSTHKSIHPSIHLFIQSSFAGGDSTVSRVFNS